MVNVSVIPYNKLNELIANEFLHGLNCLVCNYYYLLLLPCLNIYDLATVTVSILVIGRGGEQISRLQSESGCKIQMAPDSGGLPERVCTLTGNAQAIRYTIWLWDPFMWIVFKI